MGSVGLLVLVACPSPSEPELLLDGPAEVRVEQLGPVPAPRVALGDGDAPEGLIWSFSRPGVATYEQGTFLAEGPGEVDVVAEWEGERVAWRLVVELRTELAFLGAPATLVVGETSVLELATREGGVAVPPSDVTWTSSDATVLEVSSGQLRALAPGTAFVTASARGSSAMVEVAVVIPTDSPAPE